MVQVSDTKEKVAEGSISKLRDLSVYKVVVIEGKRTIRYSLISEQQIKIRQI